MNYVRPVLKQLALACLYIGIGVVLVGGWFYVDLAQQQADLHAWHTVQLEGEYRGPADRRVTDYASYVGLEDELFEELQREVYDSGDPTTVLDWSRFNQGSEHDSSISGYAWNRSMELANEAPRGGALLLHGATDSPYSMRALAEQLQARGWYVLVPRYPGHGTAPAGLTTFEWQDLTAVVDLAATHLRQRIGPEKPLVAIGYSTGGALAIEHALAKLEGEREQTFDRIVTLSPALGLAPIAAFARTQLRLSKLLGIPKLAWTDIEPEYDPYKYNSFSVNAGDQIYQLTEKVNGRLARLADDAGVVHGLPPILSFVSVVDATVRTRDAFLFHERLGANEGHELVVFDVNRTTQSDDFLHATPLEILAALPEREARNYSLTVVANLSEASNELAAWDDVPSRAGAVAVELGMGWPQGVYSLSHVALPFRADDALYGLTFASDPTKRTLGNLQMRGERSLFVISTDNLMRLRCNPFYEYLEDRTMSALERRR